MKDLPPIHNKRSPAQWDIISKHIDFKGKTVLDLGCGYGDLLYRCWIAGAKVYGVENDEQVYDELLKRRLQVRGQDKKAMILHNGSIEDWIRAGPYGSHWDIIICFSVLPYLEKFATVQRWIRNHSDIALIEMQYFRDGPGIEFIKDDNDMRDWLSGWQSVVPIGTTLVEDRQKYRTIWMCQ